MSGSPPTIRPLITGPTWTYSGTQQNENAGAAVAILGDVDGDGRGDILIGSPGHDSSFSDAGLAELFLGAALGPSATPSWSYSGHTVDERLGTSVAAAGDVNGDGYADALAGSLGSAGAGTVRAFYGSPSAFTSDADWLIDGEQVGSGFGSAIAGVGDTNGDGYSDVLIAAPAFDGHGRVYLYAGSASGLVSTPMWTADGDQLGMEFGSSLAAAGDVNRDGFTDIAVGAPSFDGSIVNSGKVLVYFGGIGGPASMASWTFDGSQANEQLGNAIASAGDANGDGFSDLVVAADGFTQAASEEGAVMMFRGSAQGLPSSADWLMAGKQAGAHFGSRLVCAGDINNDGLGDFLVGAPAFTNNDLFTGRVFVFLGNTSGQATQPAWIGQGFQEVSEFGQALSGGGDLNGDGYCDLLVGASQFDIASNANEGRSYVYLGGADAPRAAPSALVVEEQPHSLLGASVCDAGDVEDVRLVVRFDGGLGDHATSLDLFKDTFSSAVTS